MFHRKIYHLRFEERFFRATMRCWNRAGVIVVAFAQRCRYSDFIPAKLVTEKCDKAKNLVKLSANLGGWASKPAHSAGAGVRVFRSWKNTRDIPQGRNELTTHSSESSCCRCRCNFKGVCLSGRVVVTRARKRVRDLYIPFFPQKYQRLSFRRERACIFQSSETWRRKIFLSKNLAGKEKRIL